MTTLNDKVNSAFNSSRTSYTARPGSSFLKFEFVPSDSDYGMLTGYTKSMTAIEVKVNRGTVRAFLNTETNLRGQALNDILVGDRDKAYVSTMGADFVLDTVADLDTAVVFPARKKGSFVKFTVKANSFNDFTVTGMLKGIDMRVITAKANRDQAAQLIEASLSQRGKVFSKIATEGKTSNV